MARDQRRGILIQRNSHWRGEIGGTAVGPWSASGRGGWPLCVELQNGSGLRLRNSMLPGGRKNLSRCLQPHRFHVAQGPPHKDFYRHGTIKIFRPGPLREDPTRFPQFFWGQNLCKTMQRLYRRCRQDFHTKDIWRIFRARLTGFRRYFHCILSQRPLPGLVQDVLILRTGETAPWNPCNKH